MSKTSKKTRAERKALSYAFLLKKWVSSETKMVEVDKIRKGGWRPLTVAGRQIILKSLADSAGLIDEERKDSKLLVEGIIEYETVLLRKAEGDLYLCEEGNHRVAVWRETL